MAADAIWDTAPKETSKINDTAYSNMALHPHTDCTYYTSPPGLQCFNCAAQSNNGGSSTYVDGLAVANRMQEVAPEAFEFFSSTELPFQCLETGVFMQAKGKVFEFDDVGNLVRFRYNNDDRAPLSTLTTEQIDAFYRHLPTLLSLTRDPELVLPVKLEVGQLVIVNNWRVLHGRQAFEGHRNLIGCYIDMDDFLSVCRTNHLAPPSSLSTPYAV